MLFAEMVSLPNDGRYPALKADAETLVNDKARAARAIKGIAGKRLTASEYLMLVKGDATLTLPAQRAG